MGYIKSKLIKDKLKFCCKRECPLSFYCQILKDKVTAFEPIDYHKHLNNYCFLPKKILSIVDDFLEHHPKIKKILKNNLAPQITNKQLYNLKYQQTNKRLGHSPVSIQELMD